MIKINKKHNKRKQKRVIFICCAFFISILSLIFIIKNFNENIIFFYSPSELTLEIKNSNKLIKVGGLVKEDSIKRAENNKLFFVITDLKQDLSISYDKIPPDLFRAGQGIIATGKFDKNNNIFIAQELLAKHDENYMPIEVKKSLEKNIKK
ncbi:cytochrome c maturation protein CcmE [Rickettsiales bacterium]|nr:cytochrome c maturation protein CcmE [Rickettsiales bacterium]